MALEADCGVSTMLEAIRVTSTSRFPMPGKAGQQRHADRMLPVEDADWGRKIRNPKSEISCGRDARTTISAMKFRPSLWCGRLARTSEGGWKIRNPKFRAG